MILGSLLAAALTFTATATGVEKGTAVEFAFAGKNSDRDYETMFLLDGSIDDLCRRLEAAGLPRGKPVDGSRCHLWPVGCDVRFDPPLDKFISGSLPDGNKLGVIYTGGLRTRDGKCEADVEMPAALCATYSLPQSPFVAGDVFEQGVVYGRFMAAMTLKKGLRVDFTVSWDEKSMPRHLDLTARSGQLPDLIKRLHVESAQGEIDVTVGFDGRLAVKEAIAVANALSAIDSKRVKINGCSNVFYRAFLPLVKWNDRKERLQQPFELTLRKDGSDRLVYIEEDWTVEGNDPKLTPREIDFTDAAKYEKTDTCFIYVYADDTISRIVSAQEKLMRCVKIRNWYVLLQP